MPIRKAEPSDAQGIAQVLVAAWRAAYRGLLPDEALDRLTVGDFERRWRERIAAHPTAANWGAIFVAEQEDDIVGFAACGSSRDEDVDRERVGELYVIYVHPEHWRQGVGTALLDRSVDRLRKDGFEEAMLWVLRGNQRAIAFYEGAGFEADGTSRVERRADGVEMPIVRYRSGIQGA